MAIFLYPGDLGFYTMTFALRNEIAWLKFMRDLLSMKMLFTSIGNPRVETRQSCCHLISTMVFHLLVKHNLYIETALQSFSQVTRQVAMPNVPHCCTCTSSFSTMSLHPRMADWWVIEVYFIIFGQYKDKWKLAYMEEKNTKIWLILEMFIFILNLVWGTDY